MKIGIDEWSYHNHFLSRKKTVMDFIELAGELGVQGVGIDYFMIPEPYRKDPRRFKAALDKNGLELVFGFGVPTALPDLVFNYLENERKRMFELAEAWDADIIRITGGILIPSQFTNPIHVCLNKAAEIKSVARRLKTFAGQAAGHGMTLAIENHNDYNARQMLDLLDAVDSDHFKVTLDTGNALTHHDDPYETVELMAPFAVHTHLKDMKDQGWRAISAPLGQGELDIQRFVRILKTAGYRGQFCVEVVLPPWSADQEEPAMETSVNFLRGLSV